MSGRAVRRVHDELVRRGIDAVHRFVFRENAKSVQVVKRQSRKVDREDVHERVSPVVRIPDQLRHGNVPPQCQRKMLQHIVETLEACQGLPAIVRSLVSPTSVDVLVHPRCRNDLPVQPRQRDPPRVGHREQMGVLLFHLLVELHRFVHRPIVRRPENGRHPCRRQPVGRVIPP